MYNHAYKTKSPNNNRRTEEHIAWHSAVWISHSSEWFELNYIAEISPGFWSCVPVSRTSRPGDPVFCYYREILFFSFNIIIQYYHSNISENWHLLLSYEMIWACTNVNSTKMKTSVNMNQHTIQRLLFSTNWSTNAHIIY